MTDLRQKLEQLGLLQYLDVFVTEGFDTWETVLDIRESDLDSLNVKLGHRRKLQRAIAETRGIPIERLERPVPHLPGAPSIDSSYRSDDSASETRSLSHNRRAEPPSVNTGGTTKRKYRRHPKPDENAPERPASAYVIFSNQTRESLKGQELSFTEIAKLVGERWQTLSPGAREACERQAAAAKEKYYAELSEYKKTPEYAQYQEYLAEFRAKHNQQQSGQLLPPRKSSVAFLLTAPREGKRAKVERENSEHRSGSHDNLDKSHRRVSDAHFNQPTLVHQRSGSSPPQGSYRTGGHMLASESTSPAAYSFSGVNSPRIAGQYSPPSASPTSTTAFRESDYSRQSAAQSIESRERLQDSPYAAHPGFGVSNGNTTPLTAPSTTSLYSTHVPSDRDLPSRRLHREPSSIPSLVHEDTNTTNQSSDSGGYAPSHGSNPPSAPYTGSLLPLADAQKAHRLLPQPVPSTLAGGPSPFDQRPGLPPQPPTKFLTQAPQPDLRQTSSLAVLLRAGEMARERDNNPFGANESPP
ncbi:high-mobility group 20a [Diplodia corticola]|uniref:High-mobility group 20a n=1 Tax=Diplodia corticola TaxID=236234 RepID=A0A1J9QWC9_9PEZI|nr:high-mobility group 20a [Diplodia corticola]OJD32736.1 high-mobility group 20a [Diplodia corticola]